MRLALRLVVGCALFFFARATFAQKASPDVPTVLEPWRNWVLAGERENLCPKGGKPANAPTCIWPSVLVLDLGDKRAEFSLEVTAEAPGVVRLPGNATVWPENVRVGERAAPVVDHDGPAVTVEAGTSKIRGSFQWRTRPDSIAVPKEIGLLRLSVQGKAVDFPNRDEQGLVYLQKAARSVEGDRLELTVHRKITDDIPLLVETRLTINVAGKNREVLLGKVFAPGLLPLRIDSPIPARLEPDGHLRMQLRPGTFIVTLVARAEGPVPELVRPAPEGTWRDGEEVWCFEPRDDLRIVSLEGITPIDPEQTSMPAEWKKLQSFAMKVGDRVTFKERQRGDTDPGPDRLSLSRTVWLDFDGDGATFRDSLSGTLSRSLRLSVSNDLALGRVSMNGKDVFITKLDGVPGVEVRQGTLVGEADGRTLPGSRALPAVGWAHDFEHVDESLRLPPGWDLFHASGVDKVSDSWLARFRLLEIFFVLVTTVAFLRLFGWRTAILAFVLLVLTTTRNDAPRWWWLVLIVLEALARFVKMPDVRAVPMIARAIRIGALLVLLIMVVPFAVHEVRYAMYPALETERTDSSALDVMMPRGQGGAISASAPADMDSRHAATPTEAPAAAASATTVDPTKREALKDDENLDQQIEKGDNGRAEPKKAPADVLDRKVPQPVVGSGSLGNSTGFKTAQYNTSVYDPNAMVQTGPGVPSWSWHAVSLGFNGPVRHDQRIDLYLIPPWLHFVLGFLRAALVAFFTLLFVAKTFPGLRLPRFLSRGPAVAAMLAFAAVSALSMRSARAQVPSKEILDELKARLVKPRACGDRCIDIARLLLEVTPERARMRLTVSAEATTGVPLPGLPAEFSPDLVLVDGKPGALRRTTDGHLAVIVTEGVHQVSLEGALPARDSVQIHLPERPHATEAVLRGFALSGLHDDGTVDETLVLTREATKESRETLVPTELPAFVRVERTINVALNWQIDTRVVRVSGTSSAAVIEVPLLPGESVTTPDIRVVAGKVQVNLARGETQLAWHSVLEEKSPLVLTAPKVTAWMETWRLDVSPIWHPTFAGVTMIHARQGGALLPEWRPFPGETVTVGFSKPEGMAGQSVTIDSSHQITTPGLRFTDTTLDLSVRASRGGPHVLTLPEGSDLQQVTIGGTTIPPRHDGRKLSLSLKPGLQNIHIAWREPRGVSTLFSPSSCDLGAPSVNATSEITLAASSRWVLFARGPRLGPAVLFWSEMLVLLLVSIALSRVRVVPLRAHEWLLLSVGLSQTSVVSAGVFAAFLIVVGLRGRRTEVGGAALHNFALLALAAWAVAAVGVLVGAIHQGLLGVPDMQVEGYGSSAYDLRWYQDRLAGATLMPSVVSVPMLAYRGAMLLWALWMAVTVVRLARFVWQSVSHGGIWHRAPPRVVTPAMPMGPMAPPPPPEPPPVPPGYQEPPKTE